VKKQSHTRKIVWNGVALIAIATLAVFLVFFPQNYPEQTLRAEEAIRAFLDELTLPLKLARLELQEPDTEILMPVYGKTVGIVADTWQAPRDGVRVHEGQDIFAERGTPIFSGTNGYIRRIRTTDIGGNNVLITGAGGRRYYYAHLDRFPEGLHVGQWITVDTVIGFVGNTGNAITTPPHLHFGMYEGRQAINPLSLLTDRW
jgi:murein DD-endopeptidase MepM/ murein hydrolase activator NlpD